MPVLAWTAECFAGSWSRLSPGIRDSLFLLPSQLLMAADSLTCNPSNCSASDTVAIFILLGQTMDYSLAIRESTNQKRDHFPKSVDSLNSGSQMFSGFLAYWHLNTVAFKSSVLWLNWQYLLDCVTANSVAGWSVSSYGASVLLTWKQTLVQLTGFLFQHFGHMWSGRIYSSLTTIVIFIIIVVGIIHFLIFTEESFWFFRGKISSQSGQKYHHGIQLYCFACTHRILNIKANEMLCFWGDFCQSLWRTFLRLDWLVWLV